jgi:molybdate transport system substrate-binding protein
MRSILSGLALSLALGSGGQAQAAPQAHAPLAVYAAGSMTGALGAMLKRYTHETGQGTILTVGPAGLLLDKIEAGDPADVFVSANMAHPQRLTAEGKGTATVLFARNRLCVSGRPQLGLTRANLLTKLLDPQVRLGSSTPKADPGGDYAWAMFDRADAVRPGATAILKAKTRQVVGARMEPPRPSADPPASALKSMDRYGVDVMIGYCSRHSIAEDGSVSHVEAPPELAVPVDYGMTALTISPDAGRREAAARLALWLMSPQAQAMMSPYGFEPVAVEEAEAPDVAGRDAP